MLTQGRGALRQSALQPPPPGWDTSPAYLEPHRRGEVLVAVVIDVLIDIWVRRLEPLLAPDGERRPRTLDRKRAAEEGAKAAGHLLTMLIRGLDYLPPVEFEFGDLLDAVILADEEVAPDDELGYRDALLHGSAQSGIVRPPGQALDLLGGAFAPRYHGLNFAAMRTDADEVYRFMWENAQEFGIDTSYYTHVDTVRPSQRVGPDGLIVSESVAGYIQMLELTVGELEQRYGRSLPIDLAPDTPLQIFGGGTLVFDQFGRAKLHVYKPIDDWTRQVRRLEYLHRAGLYREGGTVGSTYGLARGQSFAQLHRSDAEHRGDVVSAQMAPARVRVRMYQVGFGDCVLVSLEYDEADASGRAERHVLFDLGSTRSPREGKATMESVARLVAEHTDGRLDILVVTHRHKDHLHGFGVKAAAEILVGLKPRLVLRSWTEDPRMPTDATSPDALAQLTPSARFVAALAQSQLSVDRIAAATASRAGALGELGAAAAGQISNADAVATPRRTVRRWQGPLPPRRQADQRRQGRPRAEGHRARPPDRRPVPRGREPGEPGPGVLDAASAPRPRGGRSGSPRPRRPVADRWARTRASGGASRAGPLAGGRTCRNSAPTRSPGWSGRSTTP